jgi:plastocyanin
MRGRIGRVGWVGMVATTSLLVLGCGGARPDWTPSPSMPPIESSVPSAGGSPLASTEPGSSPSTAPGTSPNSIPGAGASQPPTALTFVAKDLSFTPRELTAPSGAAVTLAIQNDGHLVHNLTIDELSVQLVASPGQTESVDLADVPPGSYTFYCSVSGHRQQACPGPCPSSNRNGSGVTARPDLWFRTAA